MRVVQMSLQLYKVLKMQKNKNPLPAPLKKPQSKKLPVQKPGFQCIAGITKS